MLSVNVKFFLPIMMTAWKCFWHSFLKQLQKFQTMMVLDIASRYCFNCYPFIIKWKVLFWITLSWVFFLQKKLSFFFWKHYLTIYLERTCQERSSQLFHYSGNEILKAFMEITEIGLNPYTCPCQMKIAQLDAWSLFSCYQKRSL